MRIIAGRSRGTVIVAPEGKDTRPTLDRVRENVFNILQRRVAQAQVLDLFAGSGAMALEAVSRGADSAVLCDISPAAASCIRKNIAKLRMEDECRFIQGDWTSAVRTLTAEGKQFDLIFLDPPYAMVELDKLAAALMPVLAPGGLIVLEHAAGSFPKLCDGLTMTDNRKYGIAGVSFYERYEQA